MTSFTHTLFTVFIIILFFRLTSKFIFYSKQNKTTTRIEEERSTEEAWNYLEGRTVPPKLAQDDASRNQAQNAARQRTPPTKDEIEKNKKWNFLEQEEEEKKTENNLS